MNKLIIKLTGEIQSSNFDKWKNNLIAQVKSTNTLLVSDDDFINAINQVKTFKVAEKTLKKAKISALEQAAGIQELFSTIDQVSEEARQTRLLLERQIKKRKLEIKNEYIKSGIKKIKEFIDQQNNEFQLIDHSSFLNKDNFDSAAKGKAGTKGMETAIEAVCNKLKVEILLRSEEVSHNKSIYDSLTEKHKLLFQDFHSILSLSKKEFETIIKKRINKFTEESEKNNIGKRDYGLKDGSEAENKSDIIKTQENSLERKEHFRLIIDIHSSKKTAIEISRSIRTAYENNTAISEFKLNHQ
jgi:hypothetical protein